MKKIFRFIGLFLVAAAVIFIIYAFNHPEAASPFPAKLTGPIYGAYAAVVVLMFLLGAGVKAAPRLVIASGLVMASAFFICCSIFIVDGSENYYLPIALLCNVVAMILAQIEAKKRKK